MSVAKSKWKFPLFDETAPLGLPGWIDGASMEKTVLKMLWPGFIEAAFGCMGE